MTLDHEHPLCWEYIHGWIRFIHQCDHFITHSSITAFTITSAPWIRWLGFHWLGTRILPARTLTWRPSGCLRICHVVQSQPFPPSLMAPGQWILFVDGSSLLLALSGWGVYSFLHRCLNVFLYNFYSLVSV